MTTSDQQQPNELVDGLFPSVEPDGRIKYALIRRKRAVGDVTVAANQASDLAANALAGAYDAFEKAQMGLVPAAERRSHYPYVRITGLGLGPSPFKDHACLVVRVGAAELGFTFPRDKLKEFARWLATAEVPEG